MAVETPHFAFPFRRGGADGTVVVIEQDTADHVMVCENVIARCPIGFRDDRPEYGIPWLEYRSPVEGEQTVRALTSLEPRSKATAETIRDWANAAEAHIRVRIEV